MNERYLNYSADLCAKKAGPNYRYKPPEREHHSQSDDSENHPLPPLCYLLVIPASGNIQENAPDDRHEGRAYEKRDDYIGDGSESAGDRGEGKAFSYSGVGNGNPLLGGSEKR